MISFVARFVAIVSAAGMLAACAANPVTSPIPATAVARPDAVTARDTYTIAQPLIASHFATSLTLRASTSWSCGQAPSAPALPIAQAVRFTASRFSIPVACRPTPWQNAYLVAVKEPVTGPIGNAIVVLLPLSGMTNVGTNGGSFTLPTAGNYEFYIAYK